MNDQDFAARQAAMTPELREMERRARERRTDRQLLEDIETRQVRIETRLSSVCKHVGLDAAGRQATDLRPRCKLTC